MDDTAVWGSLRTFKSKRNKTQKKEKRQKDDWERKEKHLLIEENLPSQKN